MSFVLSPNVSRYCFFSIPLETVVIRDTRGSIFYFNKSVLAASTSSLVAQRSGCVCFQTKRIRNVCQVSREFLISGACKAFPGVEGLFLLMFERIIERFEEETWNETWDCYRVARIWSTRSFEENLYRYLIFLRILGEMYE